MQNLESFIFMAFGVGAFLALAKIIERYSPNIHQDTLVLEAKLEEHQATINSQEETIKSQALKIEVQSRHIRRLETLLAIMAKETDTPVAKRYLQQIQAEVWEEPKELKSRLYILVSDDKINQAFELAIHEWPLQTDLVLLSSRWTRVEKEKRKTGSTTQLRQEMNNIIDSFLSIINEQ